MATPEQLESKFWSALQSDKVVMLGLDGVEDGHARPMTAQLEGAHGPIWFYTGRDNDIVKKLPASSRTIATFASKGNDLFATLHGRLSLERDSAYIDRFWNPFVAAWFKGGRDDPNLAMLRLDPGRAEIWKDPA